MLVGLRRGIRVRVAEGHYYLHPRTVFIGVSVGGISMVHKAPISAQFVDENIQGVVEEDKAVGL